MKLLKFFKGQKNKISAENKFISQVVVLAVIFGFTAGVVGQIFADVYIQPWSDLVNANLTNTNQNLAELVPELRRVKRFLGIQQDFEVQKSVNRVLPAVVGVYLKQGSGSDKLSQVYLTKDLLGSGFILTNDGWLVTAQSVIDNLSQDKLAVIYKNEKFDVDKIVADSMSGMMFIKISASDLPVVVLGDSDENTLGQLAIVVNSLAEAVVTNVENPFYQVKAVANDLILSTEKYSQSVLLENDISNLYLGSPLLNLAGEVTGVIKEIDLVKGLVTAVPVNQFRPVVLAVIKNHLVKRPYLGVVYLDLAKVAGYDKNQGALIYKKPLANTPAAESGLQVNDVIISVDGQSIDGTDDLTELIQQYQPGDEVTLEISREGKQLTKTVTLSLLPE